MPAKKSGDGKLSPMEALAKMRAEQNEKDYTKVGSLSEFARVSGYPTGNIALDYLTNVGGYPKGRIVEQFGEFSSGKTTSALQALAREQQRIIETGEDRFVMFQDYEKALDPDYAQKLGLDLEHPSLIYTLPDNLEDGAEMYRTMLNSGGLSICVFDSVAAMVSAKEQAAATGAAVVADRAKALHQFCRQIIGPMARYGTTGIFLNHTMVKVDTTPMGQQMAARGIKVMTQPGGTALPFYASLRVEFKKTTKVKTEVESMLSAGDADKAVTSQNVTATVVKNKVGAAFGTTNLRVRFGRGFSQAYSVLEILTLHKVVKKKAAGVYEFPSDVLGSRVVPQGEDKVLQMMERDPIFLANLTALAQGVLDQYGVEQADSSGYDANGNQVASELSSTPKPALSEDGRINFDTGEVHDA